MKRKFWQTIFLLIFIGGYGATVRAQSLPPPVPNPTPFAVVPVEDSSAPAGWRRYNIGTQPVLSVVLPAPPDANAERSGPELSTHTYLANSANATYGIARIAGFTINIEQAAEPTRQEFFNGFMKGFARGFKQGQKAPNDSLAVVLGDSHKVNAAAREGFEQDLAAGHLKGKAQMIFVGPNAIALIAIWIDDASRADRDAFFKSLRVTVNPE